MQEDRDFRLYVRNLDSGRTFDLDYTVDPTGAATRWAAHSNFAYDDSEFEAVIGRDLLARMCEESGSSIWQLRARVTSGGVTRDKEFSHVIKTGSAGWLRSRTYTGLPVCAVPLASPSNGFSIELRSSLVTATSLDVLPTHGKLQGTIELANTYTQTPRC
ncbi:hypothetical protein HER39_20535, partial [Arthrobacter deserti]|nr:hypothetical protein [Arthrobacter deserti]